MDASESNRSHGSRRDYTEKADARDGQAARDEDREHADRRQHQSSKSRKHSDEQVEEDSGKRRKSGGSSRSDSRDRGDYDSRRDSQSKVPRKNSDESRSSEGHRYKENDGSLKNREDRHESNSSRKTSARLSDHESSQGGSRVKAENYRDGDFDKGQGKDSRYSERKESSSREKGHGKVDGETSQASRRRDDVIAGIKGDESGYIDSKQAPTRERTPAPRYESSEDKSRVVYSSSEKDVRSGNREEKQNMDSKGEDVRSGYREEKVADEERSRKVVQSGAQDENNRSITHLSDTVMDDGPTNAQERSVAVAKDAEATVHPYSVKSPSVKEDKYRQQRGTGYGDRDEVESKQGSVNMDKDGHTRTSEKNGMKVGHIKRSRSPERSGRHHRESDHDQGGLLEHENLGSTGNKVKESEKESTREYKEERSSKGNGSNWNDHSPKENWRASQSRKDIKDSDREFSNVKESDPHRREQERLDSEKLHGRPGFRRDSRMRLEDGKSSSFRNGYEKSDSIEIKPTINLDFEREASVSTLHTRRTEVGPQQDFASGMREVEQRHPHEGRDTMTNSYADDMPERFKDDVSPMDKNSGKSSFDSQDGKGRGQMGPVDSNHIGAGQSTTTGSQPQTGDNPGPGSFNRGLQQGLKGRQVRGGRRTSGRDAQRLGTPMPMMPPPFNPLGQLQPMGPNMSHSPIQPMPPGLFFPPLSGPLVWPGARGVDMNMLSMPTNLPQIPPPGPGAPPRFSPNMSSGPTHPMYFNQLGPGRGAPSNVSGPGFNPAGPINRESPHDKASMGWATPRNSGPSGKAPSRGEQNDYSQNFVDTGMRPQNFIRELELTNTVEDYPKLRELIQRKDEIVAKSSSPPMYYKCDLHDFVLTPEFFGTKFDVILVDPPWEEYVHRAPGVTDHLEYWQLEEIQNLKIEAIADTPSFIFLWVGDGVGLEQGRQCLKKWGFRRCEDICWVKTNKRNATPGLRHDSRTLFQHSKEHCLMGIKGTVRRSTDGHIIHANIDTDIIIAEEPGDGSTKKPEDMYRIIEHFALGRRRLELFGEDHNIRSGWLTLGKKLSSSNFNAEAYVRNFADRDGKIWQGGGGRNPPPEAGHLVVTTPEIEGLRPKSPPPKNQQQPTMSLMTTGSSSNRRPSGNSPQSNAAVSYLDASNSEPATPAHWSSSPMVGSQGQEGGHGVSDIYDGYRLEIQAVGDRIEIDPRRALNML